jgi:hypothetical protein
MKCLSRTLILSFVCFLSTANAETASPVKAKEPIRFSALHEDKLSSVGTGAYFVGILYRENVKDPIESQIELYEFKDISEKQISKRICSDVVSRILGPNISSTYEIVNEEIRPSKSTGKICFTLLKDKDPKSFIKERHVFINILTLKMRGYVFKYGKSPTTQVAKDNEIQFIESLR